MSNERIPHERMVESVDPATGRRVVHVQVSTAEALAAQIKVRRMRARGEVPTDTLLAIAAAQPPHVDPSSRVQLAS